LNPSAEVMAEWIVAFYLRPFSSEPMKPKSIAVVVSSLSKCNKLVTV
jgi:hypothetical protein